MKKPRTAAAAIFAAGAAATAFAALALVDNVSVVVRWWAAFRRAGGVSRLMPGEISGVLPWFDWAAVDHSCVSTLIPFAGLLLATRGAWRILRGRPADPEFFPFFRASDQLNVSLGLVGTLWGIIVIGWHDLDSVSMRDLMSCLHTALFSTLVAVVWVYLVDHPLLRPLMRSLLRDAGLDGTERERAALDELLASLRDGARGLGEAWEGQSAALGRLSVAVDSVRGEAFRFAEAGARASGVLGGEIPAAAAALVAKLDAAGASFDSRLADIRAAHGEFLSLSREISALLGSLREAQAETAAAAADAAREASDLRGRLAAEAEAGNAVRAEAAGLRGAVAEQARALDGLRAELESAAAAREKERAEFASRWAELSGEKAALDAKLAATENLRAEESRRAERAEGLLSRIRAAFDAK